MFPFWGKKTTKKNWKSIAWTWWIYCWNKEALISLSKPAVYIKYHLLTCLLRPCRQKHNILRKRKRRLTSPVETRVTLAHQGAVWLRNPERGTSCRCRSPEWSPQQLSVPWRRRSAGRGSCSAMKSTVTGYLWTNQSFRMQNRCCAPALQCFHIEKFCVRQNELLTVGGKLLLDMFQKILLSG